MGDSSDVSVMSPQATRKGELPHTQPATDAPPRRQPPYHVVLLDDDEHTFDYVILMMSKLFRYGVDRGRAIANRVHYSGRAVVLTTTREHAELKRNQILGFGADPEALHCTTSMRAFIEPAELCDDE